MCFWVSTKIRLSDQRRGRIPRHRLLIYGQNSTRSGFEIIRRQRFGAEVGVDLFTGTEDAKEILESFFDEASYNTKRKNLIIPVEPIE